MLRRALVVAASAAALAGCQDYRFKGVVSASAQVDNQQFPVGATQKAPDIMIVQDTSGSMCEAIGLQGTSGQSCLGNDGYCSNCSPGNGTCVAGCTTKMQLTTNTFNQILTQLQPDAGQLFLGLAAFPDDTSDNGSLAAACGTGSVVVPVGDATTTIPEIEGYYTQIATNPFGGTPTAATLLGPVANDPTLDVTDATVPKYVLLVTDGLPNCDATNPCGTMPWSNGTSYGCESPNYLASKGISALPNSACACSFGDCSNPSVTASCCTGSDPNECLDGTAAIAAVTALHQKGIKTIVVGMGADYTNAAVLDGMMAAGGTGLNGGKHYQADDPPTLLAELQLLIQTLGTQCTYTLDAPPANPELITVTLKGMPLVQGDLNGGYTLTPPLTIVINGSACATLQSGGSASGKLQITAVGG